MWQKKTSKTSVPLEVISFRCCPAKTFQQTDGSTTLGRTVVEHCQIVGEVARTLITRYSENLRTSLFPPNAPLIAACHDLGKVSPCFYEKLRRASSGGTTSLKPLTNVNPELERSWGGHAGVSQVAAKALSASPYVAEILGQHHGFSPPIAGLRADDQSFGGPLWQQERTALVTELKKRLSCDDWPEVDSVPQARLLAGLTSLADWIGSGSFFEDPALPWQERIDLAQQSWTGV